MSGHDPGRRQRILDAALDVIVADGLAGASHRRIAAAAGVPLGSMTYHFDGIDALVREAFAGFASQVAASFARRVADVEPEGLRDAIVDLITVDVLQNRRDLVLTQELYTLAARDPAALALTRGWMDASREALRRHVDEPTARMLDALIEGVSLHRALGDGGFERPLVERAVTAILDA